VADEIAYNCADLDDSYEAKLLTLRLMREGVPRFDRLYRAAERKYPAAPDKLKFNEALKRLLDALVTDLISATRARLAQLAIRSPAQVRAHPLRLVASGTRLGRENQALKQFLNQRVYSHRNVKAGRQKILDSMRRLFEHYAAHPRKLPAFYFAQSQKEPVHRIVCDYIAGMTDNYFLGQSQNVLGE